MIKLKSYSKEQKEYEHLILDIMEPIDNIQIALNNLRINNIFADTSGKENEKYKSEQLAKIQHELDNVYYVMNEWRAK